MKNIYDFWTFIIFFIILLRFAPYVLTVVKIHWGTVLIWLLIALLLKKYRFEEQFPNQHEYKSFFCENQPKCYHSYISGFLTSIPDWLQKSIHVSVPKKTKIFSFLTVTINCGIKWNESSKIRQYKKNTWQSTNWAATKHDRLSRTYRKRIE